ncbi:MAG: glycosyltransferase family 2 protein [Syntrophobacteraceae bacterium]
MTTLTQFLVTFSNLLESPFNNGFPIFLLKFVPYMIFLEAPVYVLVFLGIVRHVMRSHVNIPNAAPYYPQVSCMVTAYGEGKDVQVTIRSLVEQIYPGFIEVICVVDGALKNKDTYEAARQMEAFVHQLPRRALSVVPKWQRGGRVSSLNTALELARGEIVMALDGDTSFDNNMIADATLNFLDPNVVGVAGCLRVRNITQSLWTRLQAIEYLLSIHASKTGLSAFNIVNNISGAFGVFRKSFVQAIGGWDSGTAEDLDITLRMKNYFGRHPDLKIIFEPKAMGHTDVPVSFKGFLMQRLRWDGDLFYLYVRKHRLSLQPGILGWRNLIMTLWTGLFFQLVLPFIILLYSTWTLIVLPLGYALAVWAVVYLFYLLVTLAFYVVFVLFLSERPRQDLKLAPFLPLVPCFTFLTRLWGGVSTLWEFLFKSHLDSSMAPWYVLRKTKF